MPATLLTRLFQASAESGWAVEVVSFLEITHLRSAAADLGLVPVPNRQGENIVSTLTPTTADRAHPASISATVGMGEQPLHTDGAHHRNVPDYVLMWSTKTSSTPTRIWNPWQWIDPQDQHGMFVVRTGSETFLAPAVTGRYLRYDPGCMTPADAAARRLHSALQAPPSEAVHDVQWTTRNQILFLHNRTILHGRAALLDDPDRRIERVSYLLEDRL